MAKVLVAEDEPEMRKLLVSALKEAGYETRETFDGLGALSLPMLDRLCADNPQSAEPQEHGVHTT